MQSSLRLHIDLRGFKITSLISFIHSLDLPCIGFRSTDAVIEIEKLPLPRTVELQHSVFKIPSQVGTDSQYVELLLLSDKTTLYGATKPH